MVFAVSFSAVVGIGVNSDTCDVEITVAACIVGVSVGKEPKITDEDCIVDDVLFASDADGLADMTAD